MNDNHKNITCKVCGFGFFPDLTRHYIARDIDNSGFAALSGGPESEMYDAYDCPACGSQIIVQPHKRKLNEAKKLTDEEQLEQMDPEVIGKWLGFTGKDSVKLMRYAVTHNLPAMFGNDVLLDQQNTLETEFKANEHDI